MVKRGKISFGQGSVIFRMSVPGVDVDAATLDQLLFHEGILYPQIIQSFLVPYNANPVNTALANYGQTPFVYGFPINASSGEYSFPCFRSWGGGNHAWGGSVAFDCTPTSLTTYFTTPAAGPALSGVRVVTMRRANG